jgi:hypothetical protein
MPGLLVQQASPGALCKGPGLTRPLMIATKLDLIQFEENLAE